MLFGEKALSLHIHITKGNKGYTQIVVVKVVKSFRSMDLYLRLNANEKCFHYIPSYWSRMSPIILTVLWKFNNLIVLIQE